MEKGPTDLVLIGCSAIHEIEIRQWLQDEKKERNAYVSRAFGSFPAALDALAHVALPDAIFIANWTCMADGDIATGCDALADLLLEYTEPGGEPPLVIIEDKDLKHHIARFDSKQVPHFFGFIQSAPPLLEKG